MTRSLFVAALTFASLTAGTAASAVAQAQTINVTLTEWKVQLSRDTVAAGPVTFRLSNAGVMTHGFYVRGGRIAKGASDIPAKQSSSLTVTLPPGTYEVYCPMSDLSHRVAGMTRQLVVTAAPAPAPKKPPRA